LIGDLASGHRWPDRPGLDRCDAGGAGAAARDRALEALEDGAGLLCSHGTAHAYLTIADDAWATERLGIHYARLTAPVSTGTEADRLIACEKLLSGALRRASSAGTDLLNIRVPSLDAVTLEAAERAGFEVHGSEHSYMGDAEAPGVSVVPATGTVEVSVHPAHDLPSLRPEDRRAIVARAECFVDTHLGADAKIPADGRARFYGDWATNVLDGCWGDRVALSHADGATIGFFAWGIDEDLRRLRGIDLLTKSWAVVAKEGLGAFSAMASAVMANPAAGVRWTECDTQVSNTAVNRALSQIPGVDRVGTYRILHAWP
jgi:hypothetical protein